MIKIHDSNIRAALRARNDDRCRLLSGDHRAVVEVSATCTNTITFWWLREVVHELVKICSCDGSVATVSARLENAFITTTTMILIAELVLLKLIMLSRYE